MHVRARGYYCGTLLVLRPVSGLFPNFRADFRQNVINRDVLPMRKKRSIVALMHWLCRGMCSPLKTSVDYTAAYNLHFSILLKLCKNSPELQHCYCVDFNGVRIVIREHTFLVAESLIPSTEENDNGFAQEGSEVRL